MAAETVENAAIIGGKEIRTGETSTSVMTHDNKARARQISQGHRKTVADAIRGGAAASAGWTSWALEDRPRSSGRRPSCDHDWRDRFNAGRPWLGQSKDGVPGGDRCRRGAGDFWPR